MLAQYKNGNTIVTLLKDGTKIRKWNDIAKPELPESIDLKITDYCDAGCPWCHEKSTTQGIHADINNVLKVTEGLHEGTELAIGGGNPLDFPNLEELLIKLKARGLICNLTVNSVHLEKHEERLYKLMRKYLVYGLGISYTPKFDQYFQKNNPRLIYDGEISDRVVIHLIAGIHDYKLLKKYNFFKFLVLGYKTFGFGVDYKNSKIEKGIKKWRYFIGHYLSDEYAKISFDNLGLEQLKIKNLLTEEDWNSRFMGEDGTFTMYVDAVKMEYAKTSTGQRNKINNISIKEMFSNIIQ